MPTNESIPIFEPADRVSGVCVGAVTGKRFVNIAADIPGGPTGTENIRVATCGAGLKAAGVSCYDGVDGELIPLHTDHSAILMPAGAAITAGQEVETAYPLDAPTISGTTITVDELLKEPERITRDIADLAMQRFYMDRIFNTGGGVRGGSLLVELPNPQATDMYANRDIKEVAPGQAFPIIGFDRGVPTLAKPKEVRRQVVRHEGGREAQRPRDAPQQHGAYGEHHSSSHREPRPRRDRRQRHRVLAVPQRHVLEHLRGHRDPDEDRHVRPGRRHHGRAGPGSTPRSAASSSTR
jgi:hypothetical protein